MAIWDFITDSISKLADGVGSVIDSINAPDKEKENLKSKLNSELNNLKSRMIESQDSLEKEITERLKIDMTSDSWLSKNIRPLTLAWNTLVLTGIIVANGWQVSFDSSIVQMYSGLLLLIYGFYFGSRGLEKISAINKGSGLVKGLKNIIKGNQ